MATLTPKTQRFDLGDFPLQGGATLRNAFLLYKTYGVKEGNEDRVIVYPTWYSGLDTDNEWLIGEGKALDPRKYFIVVPNMFGNGLSSSPSNTPPPFNGPRFPNITLYDNIVAQHRLLTEHLGVRSIFCALGWSMGAQQAYQWASLYPSLVKRVVPFCGSAKTSIHNQVFLEGPKAALLADAAFKNGWYAQSSDVHIGLRAFGRVYAGWGFSQEWYRSKLYQKLGFQSLEDFLVGFWEGHFLKKDPNNLLSMLWTWQNGDISKNPKYNGDFESALRAITAKAIIMPGQTDLYFPPEDNEAEVKCMQRTNSKAVFHPIPSIWGHWAGGPGTNPDDVQYINNVLLEFFNTN